MSSLVPDVANAVGVNLVAFVVGYAVAMLAPGSLAIALPFGMFWAYVLLVAIYAFSQFRKGRRRRAIVAASVAAIVLLFLATSIRIA